MSRIDHQRPSIVSHLFSISMLFFLLLQVIFGSIPWMSILKRMLGLEFRGLPASIVREYERLRDSTIGQLLDVLQQFYVHIPTLAVDATIIYALSAIALVRADRVIVSVDVERHRRNPDEIEAAIREAAIILGKNSEYVLDKFRSSRQNNWKSKLYRLYRSVRNGIRWPLAIYDNSWILVRGTAGARYNSVIILAVWLLAMIFAALGCAVYLALSFAASL